MQMPDTSQRVTRGQRRRIAPSRGVERQDRGTTTTELLLTVAAAPVGVVTCPTELRFYNKGFAFARREDPSRGRYIHYDSRVCGSKHVRCNR